MSINSAVFGAFRIRTDKLDSCAKVTLRHESKMFHIGIGRRWKGTPIRLYVADLDTRIAHLGHDALLSAERVA